MVMLVEKEIQAASLRDALEVGNASGSFDLVKAQRGVDVIDSTVKLCAVIDNEPPTL